LTAAPSGALSASTPSRGPLESFSPSLSDSSSRPTFSLKANSQKYLSVYAPDVKPTEGATSTKYELRGDAESLGDMESWKVKCQREFVLKARIEALGGVKGKKRTADGAGYVENAGTLEDEQERK
jgi:protein FRG1